MKFSPQQQAMRLTNFNPRRELHGEDPKPAADITLDAKVANEVLTLFHPELKSMLYIKDAGQSDLVSDADANHLTVRRFQHMSPFKWEEEIVGAEVLIVQGVSGKHDIKLPGCIVGKFKFTPEDGGTVGISMQVAAHPDEKQFGRLCSLIGCDVSVTITPAAPMEPAEGDLAGKD